MFCSAGFGNRKAGSSAVPIVKASSQAIEHGYRAATRKLPLPVRSDICPQRDFLYSRGMKAHSSFVVAAAAPQPAMRASLTNTRTSSEKTLRYFMRAFEVRQRLLGDRISSHFALAHPA